MLPLTIFGLVFLFDQSHFFAQLGVVTLLAVTVVLYVKPLSVLTPFKIFKFLMTYRREMGIASFWIFTGHFLGLYKTGVFKLKDIFDTSNFMIWGALAALGLFILTITSNDISLRLLKQNWKKLQRIAYVVYFVILIHYTLAEGSIIKPILFGGTYLLLKIGEIIKTRSNKKRLATPPVVGRN